MQALVMKGRQFPEFKSLFFLLNGKHSEKLEAFFDY